MTDVNPTKNKYDMIVGAMIALAAVIVATLIGAIFVSNGEDSFKKKMEQESNLIQNCLTKPRAVAQFDKNNKYAGCYVGNGMIPQANPDH